MAFHPEIMLTQKISSMGSKQPMFITLFPTMSYFERKA
jgi:hypothetical protein